LFFILQYFAQQMFMFVFVFTFALLWCGEAAQLSCQLMPCMASNMNVTGTVTITDTDDGNVLVQAIVMGLPVPNAEFGFHIHQYGNMSR
jgi:Cu/Zn superoxide dismutase